MQTKGLASAKYYIGSGSLPIYKDEAGRFDQLEFFKHPWKSIKKLFQREKVAGIRAEKGWGDFPEYRKDGYFVPAHTSSQ